jgi:glutamate synthase domain-containing protein 1
MPLIEVDEDRLEAAARGRCGGLRRAQADERGRGIEIYKEVGCPADVAARFEIARMAGPTGSATRGWRPSRR